MSTSKSISNAPTYTEALDRLLVALRAEGITVQGVAPREPFPESLTDNDGEPAHCLHELADSGRVNGVYNLLRNTIYYDNTLDPAFRLRVLLHEATHALLYTRHREAFYWVPRWVDAEDRDALAEWQTMLAEGTAQIGTALAFSTIYGLQAAPPLDVQLFFLNLHSAQQQATFAVAKQLATWATGWDEPTLVRQTTATLVP